MGYGTMTAWIQGDMPGYIPVSHPVNAFYLFIKYSTTIHKLKRIFVGDTHSSLRFKWRNISCVITRSRSAELYRLSRGCYKNSTIRLF